MIRPATTHVLPEDAGNSSSGRTLFRTRPTKASGSAAPVLAKSDSKFQAGEACEVNYRGHGCFDAACVEADYENGLYDVVYEIGERDLDVPEDMLRKTFSPEFSEADPARPYKFAVGDGVLANYREIGRWIPAKITKDRGHGVFDVHFEDGYYETKVHYEHIRAGARAAPAASSYRVGESVEANCEGLGIWYHAVVRNLLPLGDYNIQYDDGEMDYDVGGQMLRAGG
ncbi:hypothetical protein B484DRAFT_326027, partial [Ochromonadaceae sp. CCMP2298]